MPFNDLAENLYADITHNPDILRGIAAAARQKPKPTPVDQLTNIINLAEDVLLNAEAGLIQESQNDNDPYREMHRALGKMIGHAIYAIQDTAGAFIEMKHIHFVLDHWPASNISIGEDGHADTAFDLVDLTKDIIPFSEHIKDEHDGVLENCATGKSIFNLHMWNIIMGSLIWRLNTGESTTKASLADNDLTVDKIIGNEKN